MATTLEKKPYAFLSYSRKDEGLVHQLAAYLAQEEIPPWVDNQLEFGERWEDVIMERLQGCTVFLIAMSPDAKASVFVNRELSVALAQRKLIIPILLRGEPFLELQEYQYVSLTDTDKTAVRFIERVRDLLTPDQVPSQQVQRRKVEHFLLEIFETIFGVSSGARVVIGIGVDKHFGVRLEQSLAELDELDWAEVFVCLRERLPHRDFHCPVGEDYGKRFPTIKDVIDFVFKTLTWEEIRVL